jgi:hypothetical protein
VFRQQKAGRWIEPRLIGSGGIIDRQVYWIKLSRTMYAVAFVALNALSFASLAYVANRKGYHAMAALLAAGAWLFGVASVWLILVWRWWSVEEPDACSATTAGRRAPTGRSFGVHLHPDNAAIG